MSSVATGATVTSISSSVRMLGNEKEKHCDFAGVAGAFMVSQVPDLDDVQDVVELRRAWPRPYSLSRLVLGFGTTVVARVTRVLVATQARVIVVGSGGGSNFRHREAWAKTVAQRAPRIHRYRHLRLCLSSPLVLLILVCFLVRSHHFDCFSVASACCTFTSSFFTCTPPRCTC